MRFFFQQEGLSYTDQYLATVMCRGLWSSGAVCVAEKPDAILNSILMRDGDQKKKLKVFQCI